MKKRLILMINLVILILVFSSLVLASPPVIHKSEIKYDISPENSYFSSEKSFVRATNEKNNLNNVFQHINNHILLSVNKAKSFNEAEKKGIKAKVYIDKNVIGKEEKVSVSIKVINSTDEKIILEFSTSQKYDIWIKNQKGEVVYKWSENKIFTQAFQKITICAGEKLKYEEKLNLDKLSSGFYLLQVKIENTGGKILSYPKKIWIVKI